MATVTNVNGKTRAGNGLGPRTRIISLSKTDLSQAELNAAILYLTAGDVAGTNDAHTVAGITAFVAGETDAVYVALQGTGAFTAASDFGEGSTGVTSALVADFDQVLVG